MIPHTNRLTRHPGSCHTLCMSNTATFRKTKTGEWVAFGPASVVRPGPVTITKKNGQTKTVTVARVGKPFAANGTTCCYGYIDDDNRSTRTGTRRRSSCPTDGNCSSFHRRCHECGTDSYL